MSREALVQLALETMACSQKELAAHIGVSPAQISKWKKGEHMSADMEVKLRTAAGIGEMNPDFIRWAGSLAHAEKWEKVIKYMAGIAYECAETGYDTEPLSDPDGSLCASTCRVLDEMGVERPDGFPEELDLDYETADMDELSHLLESNPYSSLIGKIYDALNDVYGFYAAYIADLIYDEKLDLFDTAACNIEPCLISLAAAKVDVEENFARKTRSFTHRTNREFEEWLNVVKEQAFRCGVPLKAELIDLVNQTHNELSHSAEAESLGSNASRIHPDIYMNELLVGMRVIHQVLPAIMKKLGIDQEFELDPSSLSA